MANPNIPVNMAVNPYNVATPGVLTKRRGGLIQIGTASDAVGKNVPVYVFDSDGFTYRFDGPNGAGTPDFVTGQGTPGQRNYLVAFNGASVDAQPTFNFMTPNADNGPVYSYACTNLGA